MQQRNASEEAGFTCEFRSVETLPATAYVATQAGDQVEIEFITNAKGSGEGVRSVQSASRPRAPLR